MAEMTNLRPTYDVSPVLAGFLGAGVLVVTVMVAMFLWTLCQRRYRRMTGLSKLSPYDTPVDPPFKFIHMLKGISIYPEALNGSKKIVRVGRRHGNVGSSSSSAPSSLTSSLRDWRYGFGSHGNCRHNVEVDAGDSEAGFLEGCGGAGAPLQMNPLLPPGGLPRLERSLPIRADYCCLESSHPTTTNNNNTTGDTASPPISAPLDLGTLSLAVDYNFPKRALVVSIVGARGLPAVDTASGTSDPYVKMIILPEGKHRVKTRVLRKTLSPVFDETFTFYGVAFSLLPDLTLHFLVLSFDRFARDHIIGDAMLPLAGVDPSKGCVHINQPISRRNTQYASLGELLVSVSYHPATQRLNVVVLKAKHLPHMDITTVPNPYVKVNVFYGRKRIAKKKTHVKRGTLNPVFNESFIYEVPAMLMPDLSLEFQLLDFQRPPSASTQALGHVLLGGQSPSPDAVTHWREVLDNPRRQIAKWHNLEEF